MTTLLESKAKPFGSSKGMVFSMVLHGGLIAAAVFGTAATVLPPREKVEEHPVLYVATKPPPPVVAPPEPLKAVPRKAATPKAPPAQKRLQPPQPKPAAVQQPKLPPTPALTAPIKVAVSIPVVDLAATPTITDVIVPPSRQPAAAGSRAGGTVRGTSDGDVDGRGGMGSGSALSENQVDRAVEMQQPLSPRYPESLRSVNVEGSVQLRFIVGADGRVERGSIEVVSSSHRLFSEAVKNALLSTRFRPAEAGGQKVRQLVEQTFGFKLDK